MNISTPEAPLVLVVDDDADTRFLYAESLVHLGYRTAGERDGPRGIEAALRLHPDAILMDVAMPGMSGIEATRLLKADPRTSHCLVIMVTGSGMTRFDEARAAGCDAFFCKPFDPSAIEHVLRALAVHREGSTEPPPAGIVKRCGCGRDFSRSQWLALPSCGRLHLPRRNTVVELRNCPCGSSLALEEERAAESPSQPSLDPGLQREPELQTVIVVDRDPHVRRLVLHFIGSAYLVEFFEDGYSALDRVRKAPPCALVAEIMIPRLDGLALCRLLKGDPATAGVPILLFSILDAEARARGAAADDFIRKPLEKERFAGSLCALTERSTRRGAPPPREQDTR